MWAKKSIKMIGYQPLYTKFLEKHKKLCIVIQQAILCILKDSSDMNRMMNTKL